MSKKHRLQIHKSSENERSEFFAFGLSSAEKDYRLAYFIGKELKLKLERIKTTEIFFYEDEQLRRRLRFFPNRQGETLILPQLREADYFALIYCLEEDTFAEEVRKAFTTLPVIQSVFSVPHKYQKVLAALTEENN